MCDVLLSDQAGEEAVKSNLLSWTPCMFLERQAGNDVGVTADRAHVAEKRITEFQGKLVVKGHKADPNGNRARNLQREPEYTCMDDEGTMGNGTLNRRAVCQGGLNDKQGE